LESVPIVLIDVSNNISGDRSSRKSPTVAELEYIEPLWSVFESGNDNDHLFSAKRETPLRLFVGTWISLVHCSAPIE
jgi:hypothetical protein